MTFEMKVRCHLRPHLDSVRGEMWVCMAEIEVDGNTFVKTHLVDSRVREFPDEAISASIAFALDQLHFINPVERK